MIGSGATTTSFPISPAPSPLVLRRTSPARRLTTLRSPLLALPRPPFRPPLLFPKPSPSLPLTLVMPQGVDFAAREVMDGLSIRIVRAYDINNDKFPLPPRCSVRLQDSPRAARLPLPQQLTLGCGVGLRGFFHWFFTGVSERHRMSISTYTELKTALINWGKRPDLSLRFSATFIALAEARIQRSPVGESARVETEITMTVGHATFCQVTSMRLLLSGQRQAYRAKSCPTSPGTTARSNVNGYPEGHGLLMAQTSLSTNPHRQRALDFRTPNHWL